MATTTAPVAAPIRRDSDDITDHTLVSAVRIGDDRAFEQLYRRYHRRIAAYIQGMVHDHARAEDVTQDVFMSALRRMRQTDRPIAFKPWIYEIAKNACIDQFRRSRRAEVVSMDADDTLGSADYGKLVTKDPGPDVAVENKQSLDHLCGAFGGLSETHHEILVMRELEGLSYREIGERLGMTRPAVESTLFRARRRLTEEYEQLVTGERCRRVQGIIATAAQGSLGARDRRRLARHVSYCQPCLRHARMSGIDSAELARTPLRAKIAALLPLPAFLKRRLADDSGELSTLATWSAQASSVDPGFVSTWGKAAATAATIALAGVGAGVATDPDSAARAALGESVLERLGGERDDRRASSDAPVAIAAPVQAPVATRAGGPAAASGGHEQPRTTDRRAPRRRDRDASEGGGSGSGGGASSGGGGSSAGSSAPSSTRESSVTAAAPSTQTATDTAQETTESNPVSDTLSRLGGGSHSTSTSTETSTSSPSIQLPKLTAPQSTPTAPLPTDETTTPVDVGSAVSGTTDAVGDTVTGVTDAATGMLGGE
jgi:RNA polymerase sigma factor (sigma-70 family)